jgi:outer membrane protein OmpA-like peptidoglycan-associated protein
MILRQGKAPSAPVASQDGSSVRVCTSRGDLVYSPAMVAASLRCATLWLPAALLSACQVHASASASVNAGGDAHAASTAGSAQERAASKPLLALDLDFEFDRAKLNDADHKTIADNVDAVCKLIETHKRLTIEGHADSRGPADRNLQLSQERAGAVREELLANKRCRIAATQLVAVGYGEKEPRRCHEPAACDGNDHGPKSCEDCWNENRMTIISIPAEPVASTTRAPAPEAVRGPASCSQVLLLGEQRGSRMCH